MVVFGLLILAGAAVSVIVVVVGGPISRVRDGRALTARVVVRFGAALVLGVFTVKAARYGAARYPRLEWLLLVPGMLTVFSFASASVLAYRALADSSASRCRVGLHRWTDTWSDVGPHRACARCGLQETAKQRAIWAAALLGALTFALGTPAASIAVGVYVATRLPPNYSLARSTACWRAHGYRVSPDKEDQAILDRRFTSIEIRGHHDHEYAIFAPGQTAAWALADDGSSSDYGPPSVPVRNVIFGAYGTFDDKPILACLRTSKD